jgi:hypothetical protein
MPHASHFHTAHGITPTRKRPSFHTMFRFRIALFSLIIALYLNTHAATALLHWSLSPH